MCTLRGTSVSSSSLAHVSLLFSAQQWTTSHAASSEEVAAWWAVQRLQVRAHTVTAFPQLTASVFYSLIRSGNELTDLIVCVLAWVCVCVCGVCVGVCGCVFQGNHWQSIRALFSHLGEARGELPEVQVMKQDILLSVHFLFYFEVLQKKKLL